MYFHALRSLSNMTIKLREPKNLRKIFLLSQNIVLFKQQQLYQYASLHTSAWNSTEVEAIRLPKDPNKRKALIDENAQKEIDDMIKRDSETATQLKVFQMEIDVLKYNGGEVPEKMKATHWLELLKLKSKHQRKKYLSFLFKIEKKTENRKRRQIESQEKYEKYKEEREPIGVITSKMVYGVGHNSLFRRITDSSMNQFWKWNSLKALSWGNKIVFDFSYEQFMKPQEIRSCAKQIMESYAANRMHITPFHVYLCNVDFKGPLFTTLIKFIPTILDDDFPWTVTSKPFVEIFNKQSLVYLTGHSNEELKSYDPDSVYIIGAFVDKTYKQPVSLAKAKELRIRSGKLPIDRFLHFGDGSNKNLTLNQVMGVMLDVQIYNWEKAMEHVPKRKLMENRIHALERKMQREYLSNMNNYDGSSTKKFQLQSSSVFNFSHNAQVKFRRNFQENKERTEEEH